MAKFMGKPVDNSVVDFDIVPLGTKYKCQNHYGAGSQKITSVLATIFFEDPDPVLKIAISKT